MPSCFPPQIRSSCLCVSSAFPGLLVEPLIFLSSSTDGVSTGRKQGSELLIGSNFSIMCSIRPQYEGGSFQLIFSTSNYTQNHTLPAVNHSALFLFSAAGHAHQGTYRCVYHVYVFSYNFSSMSQPLNLTVSVSAYLTALIIRLVVVLLGLLGSVLVLYFKVLHVSCMMCSVGKVLALKLNHPLFPGQEKPEVWTRKQPS
ncbi:uncharacterized protein LOC122827658 isoform X3 [Gambusia affinis]|uniref:uncharacterized protein LOC122827658 isoform X3 n=1 Tax=Gambusia affinis TaxID=33528 RepID=UPI001CDBAAE7|nr:uncharacterized protein LOC122827658 isoform X3 [Gambusia affinis]